MCPVLAHIAFLGEKVSTEQAVEINQDHNVHQHHGGKKISTVIKPGVIVHDVPGEVELGAQTKCNVGEEVGEFVDVVHGGGLSASQLQHQPQVQSDTVHLHEQGNYSTSYVQLSVEGVQETPDHLRRRRQTEW